MKKIAAFFLVFIFCTPAKSQSVKQVKDSVSYYMAMIKNHSLYYGRESDSLDYYNEGLKHYLVSALSKQPLTLQTEFEDISVSSSEDKKFRIYWWDQEGGGTMHGYYSVVQYQTNNGVKAEVIYPKDGTSMDMAENVDGPGFFYPKIYSVRTTNNNTLYLAIRNGRYMTWDVSSGIKAFTIYNDKIIDTIKVFKTSRGVLNAIDYVYNFFSNYDTKTNEEKHQIRLSPDKKKLYIPIVVELNVTNRNLLYIFDGNNYVFDKNLKQ